MSDRLKQGTNTECVLDSRCWKIFGEDLDDSEISDEDFDELEILDEDSDELDPLDVKIERSSMSHQSSLIHMEYSSWNGLDIVKNPVSEHLDDNANETEIKESKIEIKYDMIHPLDEFEI